MNLADKRALLDRIDHHLADARDSGDARLRRAVLQTRDELESKQLRRPQVRRMTTCEDLYATRDRAVSTIQRSRSLLETIAAARAQRLASARA